MAKYCTKCGAELTPGCKFCTRCGAKTEDIGNMQPVPENPNDKKGLKPWQIALIAGGGFLLALIIVIVVASSSCGSNKKSSSVSTTKSDVATTKATTSVAETTTTKTETTEATTSAPTTAAVDYSQYSGGYMANTGGAHCPSMDISDKGSYVEIYIYWGAGISGYGEWTMTAKKDGDKLVYSDCTYTYVYYDSSGNKTYETKYTNGSGYFVIDGSNLSGSGTKDFSEYLFEKCD